MKFSELMAHGQRATRTLDVPTGRSPPYYSANFFKTPIEALSASLRDGSSQSSNADLSEAYSVLTDRIKTFLCSSNTTEGEASPALEYLRVHAGIISDCAVRDIGRTGTLPPCQDRGHNAEDIRRAAELVSEGRCNTLIAHLAMQLVSSIFAVPLLSTLFTGVYHGLDFILAVSNT